MTEKRPQQHNQKEHGKKPPYVIPDYRIYKVEDIPLLVKTQKALAKKNLCNPWLRNEVWRYDPKQWGTQRSRAIEFFSRGYKLGIPAFVITVIISEVIKHFQNKSEDEPPAH